MLYDCALRMSIYQMFTMSSQKDLLDHHSALLSLNRHRWAISSISLYVEMIVTGTETRNGTYEMCASTIRLHEIVRSNSNCLAIVSCRTSSTGNEVVLTALAFLLNQLCCEIVIGNRRRTSCQVSEIGPQSPEPTEVFDESPSPRLWEEED